MVLFVNACTRPESRTLPLAKKAADFLSGELKQVDLFFEKIPPLDNKTLNMREKCISRGDFSDPYFCYARDFKAADEIIIAAPYWDLSFPAVLKCYTEAVCINGLTFRYGQSGIPEGLCNAKRLIYVTTAGGFIPERNFGFDYIRQLCTDFFGIGNCVMIKAEGLDIIGNDEGKILKGVEDKLRTLLGGGDKNGN